MNVTSNDYDYGLLPRVINEYPVRNKLNQPLIEGCNYHLTFQSHRAMRFILHKIMEDVCEMRTRNTKKRSGTGESGPVWCCKEEN